MPSTITHSYFVNDVYNHLNVKTKELLYSDKKWLQTTGQGMDVTTFYNVMFPWRKGANIRYLGGYLHISNTYNMFKTLIDYIKYHETLMNNGPLPFNILETAVDEYINENR